MYRRFLVVCFILAVALPVAASPQGDKKDSSAAEAAKASTTDGTSDGSAPDKAIDDGDPPAMEPEKPKDKEVDKEAYTVRLRDLEDRVNRLKEKIFRSKARLSLLAETVLDRKIAGAKAAIIFRNEMGGSFRLVKATFLLDGGPIFNKSDEVGNLANREQIDLFDGPVMPGEHILSVVLHYQGHGFGIFSYLKGYSFKTRASHTFTIGEGKAFNLKVVAYEKGGVTTPLEERPAVRFVESVVDYSGPSAAAAKAKEAELK